MFYDVFSAKTPLMIIDELRKKAMEAMKAKDSVATTILRLAQGEIQQQEAKAGKTFNDEESLQVIRKIVKSNEETIAQTEDGEKKTILVREVSILREMLPKSLSVAEILEKLDSVKEEIKNAKAQGMAIGIATKLLKAQSCVVESADIAKAVETLRS